jgi:type IV secretion system protein VirB4
LTEALDQLASGEINLGDHHFSLQILTEPFAAGNRALIPQVQKHLNDHVADARARLADTGILVAREDLALEGAFWAQLPGHFALRPRVAPITSRNFTGMNPFHNYPAGLRGRGHWGGAIATLPTSAGSPYAFALHVGDIGHTFLCGPTGSGKTVLVAFLLALYHRRGATQVAFDKDRGLEIVIRALGGRYLPLKSGVTTGFNPLSLPVTPGNIEFLRNWLRVLARPANSTLNATAPREFLVREEMDLDHALRGTLALDPSARRLSRLIEFLDRTDPEGLHARLARWCEATHGETAWVFDNPIDTVVPMLAGQGPFGFDVTEFLDHATIRTPVTLYLFHLVRQLLDGRQLVCWLDEFWRMLSDPAFEQFAKDGPKTWRKLNGAMCLATQSASDVLASPLSHTIVEQTPTKIFFPNIDASLPDYREGFGLSARQFALIQSGLSPGSHQFLIKKGHQSAVVGLDLTGLDEELAVLSARSSSLRCMETMIASHGEDPAHWLQPFLAAMRRPSTDSDESLSTTTH